MYGSVNRAVQDLVSEPPGERRFPAVVDQVREAIFQCDLAGTLQFLNRAWNSITGFPPQASLGSKLPDYILPEDQPRLFAILEILRNCGSESCREEFRLIRRDGQIRWVELQISALSDDSHPEALIGTLDDITLRKEHEIELREARTAADRANQARIDLLAAISREVRAPISGILGMARSALESALSPGQHESLSLIRLSADALLQKIDDLSDLSRIEAGELSLESIDFKLGPIIHQSVKAMEYRAAGKGLKIGYDIDPQVREVLRGDPLRLQQILARLLGHAIKFTRHGAIKLRVEPAACGANFQDRTTILSFKVADTSAGLSSELREKIFRPFAQAGGSITREFGDTGLGLTLSRKLVEMMNGAIHLVSPVPEDVRETWFSMNRGDVGVLFGFTAEFREGDPACLPPAVSPEESVPVDPLRIPTIKLASGSPRTGVFLDQPFMLAQVGHDPFLMRQFARTLLEQLDGSIHSIQRALLDRDFRVLESNVYSLKSTLETGGAWRSAIACQYFEALIGQCDFESFPDAWRRLEEELSFLPPLLGEIAAG